MVSKGAACVYSKLICVYLITRHISLILNENKVRGTLSKSFSNFVVVLLVL